MNHPREGHYDCKVQNYQVTKYRSQENSLEVKFMKFLVLNNVMKKCL